MKRSPPGRLPVRQLALLIALAYFVLVGGTNLGTYLVPFAAVNAIIASALVALWLVELPRNNDLTDRLLLLGLLAFLLTCVTSAFPRMSFEAATSVTSAVAAFGVARGELRSGRADRAAITVLAVCGSILALGFLAAWIPQWIQWWRGTGTIPPLDLPLRAGPYRHYHIAAMMLALLVPALFQFRQRARIGLFARAAVIAALAGVYMAGSRTAWVSLLLIGVATIIVRVRIRPAVIAGAVAVVGGLGVLAFAGALGATASRLLTTLTLAIRAETWASALDIWLERPVTGWGPGSFASVFRFQQDLPIFPDPGGHAHNVFVQVLLEAGVVGLVALVLGLAALVIGIWRNERRSPYALMGVAVFGLMSLTDLPSNFPMVLAIGVCWAALAAPRMTEEGVATVSSRRMWPLAMSGVMGAIIFGAVTSTLIGWAAFDAARTHLNGGDLSAARRALDQAVAFDPSMPLYWRLRGTLAEQAGDRQEAKGDLERALELNSGDATTLRALAVLAVDRGELAEAIHLARRAVALRVTGLNNQLMLAWVAIESGDGELATQALGDALIWYPWAAAAPTWTALFGPEVEPALHRAAAAWQTRDRERSWEATWLRAMTGAESLADLVSSSAAVNAIIRCDPGQAARHLTDGGGAAHDKAGLTPQLMLASLLNDQDAFRAALAVAILLKSDLRNLAVDDPGPASPFSDYAEDVGLYKRIPFPPAELGPMLPTSAQGLAAWLQDPREAARRGAPRSALAKCEA